ncbi:GntR family transcriptional regulator [Oxyplasma meridianum]|uniref:GntR family transcriptional regulator n=1 Tax=Oxyplasma meridianum TaxID=3073602 RepID=A0AAX4NH73_9ARCH
MGQRVSLSSSAYEYIYGNIAQGKFKVGQSISEEAIAKQINISRTPIRESLIALNKEGLLEKAGRSYRVVITSPYDLLDLYEARKIIETENAKLCAIRISSDQISDFTKFMVKATEIYRQSSVLFLMKIDLDDQFHDFIDRNSGNKYMEKYGQEIRKKLRIVRITSFPFQDNLDKDVREHEHESVFQAIINRDPLKAYEEMTKHEDHLINYVKNQVLPKLFKL